MKKWIYQSCYKQIFPKNKRDNIQSDEKEAFKKLAAHLLNIPDESVEALIENGAYIEVKNNVETV